MATIIPINEVSTLAAQVLLNCGLPQEDVYIIVAHLLDGELAGHASHGFYRIPGIVSAVRNAGPSGEISIEVDEPAYGLLNGANRQGLVVGIRGVETLLEKVRSTKLALVGAYNYVGTTGSMGYFTRRIADAGFLGLMVAGSEAAVAPWGGTEMIIGTNPISIGIPTQGDPIVVDLATSARSYGDLALAMKEGLRIPEGIVLDANGNPSTDPNDADTGSTLPMAGHKGYALGLAFEILAGPLVKAKAGAKAVPGSDGFMMLAIDPTLFITAEKFRSDVSNLVAEIKNSKLRPGFDEINYPGERSHIQRLKALQEGRIAINDRVLEDLRILVRS